MHINVETFELLLRKRRLTQASLAERAKLGVKTVGRIKRREEVRYSNAAKIADALGVTIDVLQAPPSGELEKKGEETSGMHRLVSDMSGWTLNMLALSSLRYGVSEDTILEAGPFMFTILAELSLKRRRDALEKWKDMALKAVATGPKSHDFPDLEMIKDDIWALYHEELESIENRDLSGGFNDLHPYWNGAAGHDPDAPCHPFYDMLEDLAMECDHEISFGGLTPDDMVPRYHSFHFEAVDNLFSNDQKAYWNIHYGHVLLRDMPVALLKSGTPDERIAWLREHPDYQPGHDDSEIEDESDVVAPDPIEADTDEGGCDA